MFSGQHAEGHGLRAFRTIISFVLTIAIVLGLSWLLHAFVFQAYAIPSGSMEETIMTGDMIFSEKVTYYGSDPKQGDIVTFDDPLVPGRVLIKRVIATGGQTVDFKDGAVVVDGVALEEDYTNGKQSIPFERTAVEIEYPYTVPEGELWVMGDNRTDSQDSRYFGSIKVSSVTGRAIFVYWPLSEIGPLS